MPLFAIYGQRNGYAFVSARVGDKENVYRETITKRVSADINECIDELKAQAKAAASDKCDFDIADVEYRINDDGVVAVLYGILQLE